MNSKDKQIVRELAARYMELAQSERQAENFRRMRDTNDLKLVRPPVLLDEIPWYQINIDDELTCLCEDDRARKIEEFLRHRLYYAKHFKADTAFEPFYRVTMAYDSTGVGVKRRENILRTDSQNNIVSHGFEDVLEDESSVDQILVPTFTARPDKDADNLEFCTELFGEVMPVKLCGLGPFNFAPWDRIAELRGIEPILYDLYDRPEHLHAIMERFCLGAEAQMDFIEKNMHVDPEAKLVHCTPALVSGLDEDGLGATWFRATAQAFSEVAPSMFEEFEIDYIKLMAERFKYTYYGCCEPLDRKFEQVKKIKNLRKVGVSPWANVEAMAEMIGGDFVYARKPNPAHVAMATDPEVIRRETEETVRACIRHGCPCEFVLKDISGVSHKPENLIIWSETVSAVLDEYYGK